MKNERYFFQIYLSTFVSIVRRYWRRRGSIYRDKHTLKRNACARNAQMEINSIARTMRMFEKNSYGELLHHSRRGNIMQNKSTIEFDRVKI